MALRIARSGTDAVRIIWPYWAEGYRVESSNGVGQNWTAVTEAPTPGEGEVSVTFAISTNQFYRLVGP